MDDVWGYSYFRKPPNMLTAVPHSYKLVDVYPFNIIQLRCMVVSTLNPTVAVVIKKRGAYLRVPHFNLCFIGVFRMSQWTYLHRLTPTCIRPGVDGGVHWCLAIICQRRSGTGTWPPFYKDLWSNQMDHGIAIAILFWLVVWNIFYVPIYWE